MPEPTATISVPSEDPKKVEKKPSEVNGDASKKKDDAKVGEDLVSDQYSPSCMINNSQK